MFSEKKPTSLLLRFFGVLGGMVAGALLSALLYVLVAVLLGLITGGINVLATFTIVGGVGGAIIGFLYPKRVLGLAWIVVCNCIPGV